jgi:hypothetical protein
MVSTTSWILFGIIALVAVVVIWKWWKKPVDESKKNDDSHPPLQTIAEEDEGQGPGTPTSAITPTEPPPMVFAVNDDGNFDLTDMAGKILNIGFGPNPKTYINLLDQSEKDTVKDESTGKMTSTVGTTKLYQVGGRPYIVNFTRL